MADEKLTVGQEVRVFDRSLHSNCPPEGWPGRVVKVGRKYATVEYARHPKLKEYPHSAEFDMADGWRKGSPFGDALRVLTPAQVEREERLRAAKARIRDGRQVELCSGCSLSLEQIEAIAAIVAPAEGRLTR